MALKRQMVQETGMPGDLAQFGFEEAKAEPKYRIMMGTEGLDKTGKTEFALSAPGPIGVLNLDFGMEGVSEKWVKKGKKIWLLNFNVGTVSGQGEYLSVFNKSRDAYKAMLAHPDIRTAVVDTGSDWWELARLAEFGQLSPAADVKRAYAPLNQLFRSLMRAGYDTDKNIIFTHKVQEIWERRDLGNGKGQDVRTGEFVRSGFKEDSFIVQANIRHFRDEEGFGMRVINCRQNMDLAGFEFRDRPGKPKECNFTNLAMSVFEGTTEKNWQ